MADTIENKEDVIEDQNDATEDKEDVIEDQNDTVEDKEDVIEDQNDSIESDDNKVLNVLGEVMDAISGLKADLITIKESTSLFVENGGVIREDVNDTIVESSTPQDDTIITPIDELDLNI